MKKKLYLIPLLFSLGVQSQKISTNFEGYFENRQTNTPFHSFHFDGKGHTLINDTISGVFFKQQEKVYVTDGVHFFIFKTANKTITGIDTFGNEAVYMKIIPHSTIQFETYKVNPKLLSDYFNFEYDIETNESKMPLFSNPEQYLKKTEKLCIEGLTVACEAYLAAQYLQYIQIAYKTDTAFQITKNKEIEKICTIYAQFDPGKAYLFLAAYYASLKDNSQALDNFNRAKKYGNSSTQREAAKLAPYLNQ